MSNQYETLSLKETNERLIDLRYTIECLEERKKELITKQREEFLSSLKPGQLGIEFRYYPDDVCFAYLEGNNLVLHSKETKCKLLTNRKDWIILNEEETRYVEFHYGSDGSGICWSRTSFSRIGDLWDEWILYNPRTMNLLSEVDLEKAGISFTYVFETNLL